MMMMRPSHAASVAEADSVQLSQEMTTWKQRMNEFKRNEYSDAEVTMTARHLDSCSFLPRVSIAQLCRARYCYSSFVCLSVCHILVLSEIMKAIRKQPCSVVTQGL